MANRLQLRRGGAQEWANENPTLAQGEIGIELDTNRFKIGDGVRGWNTLPYERPIESVANTANTLVVRDADGNFSAGSITATVIGNAATASRLANPRQIQLSSDLAGSGTFDGSGNLSIAAQLQILTTLPHYDGTTTSTGDYTKVTVDAKGRITNASQPSSYTALGLTDVQPLDTDLTSIAGLTSTGLLCRASAGNMVPRTINGSSGRISVVSGSGVAGNPTIDLPDTTIAVESEFVSSTGQYNIPSLTSVGGDSLPTAANITVNATRYTVDQYGRFTSALTIPIATAIEGSKYAAYNAGTTYVRYDIIEAGSKVYQAITGIASGGGAPTHSDSSDAGGWRYLAAAKVEQKGLASFAQEDFDVDDNGHVSIAAQGIDNTQLQNNRLSFSDNNTQQNFELDQELTIAGSHHGFDYLNYIKINDTSGNLLFGANNTGDGGAGEIDINVRSYFSDPDVTFDGAVAQMINKTGDGNFTLGLSNNSGDARNLTIVAANTGAGTSNVVIQAEDTVTINATEATGKVHVEDVRVQTNYIATTNATMYLDPGDDRAVTGTVVVSGDLQVDGTTTTVNSTTLQVDDPIVTLGGDTAPVSDDNKDRGVEFRYYDASAKVGFFGYDDSATDLGGHTGAFSFLYDATNTSEVFSGTDAGIIAGNLSLTTNTNSTSNTTGDLVVAGGAGIGDDVNIGGTLDVDTNFRTHGTSRFDDNIVFQGASKTLSLNNGSGTTKIQLHTTTGNVEVGGILTNTGNIDANSNLNVASLVHFESTDEPTVALNGGTGNWDIQSADYGAVKIDGGGYVAGDWVFDKDLYVNGLIRQKDDTTANFNLKNYLSVRYKLRVGSTVQHNPSYADDNTSNLRVYGGAGIVQDLHIGDDLYIGKVNSGDTVEFQVLGESGNTTIGRSGAGTASVGTLTVYGDTTLDRDVDITGNVTVTGATEFNSTVDVDADFAVRNGTTDKFFVDNVTGNTNIEGTLTADGHTELNSTLNVDSNTTIGGTLEVTNNSEFNGTVDVDNNFAVRNGTTDKFTVASSTGNTVIVGELNVNSAVDLDSTLNVDAGATFQDNVTLNADNKMFKIQTNAGVDKFTVDYDNGNTNILGTLDVSLASNINNTLGVTGITSITNNTQQTLTGSYAADGSLQVTGGAGIARDVAIGGSARIYGNLETTGTLTQTDDSSFAGKVTITDSKDITSFADAQVSLTTTGGARVNKNLYTGGDFIVYDQVGSQNSFFIDASTGNAELRNNMQVGGNLTVLGTTTTVESTVTTVEDPVMTLGGASAPGSDDGLDRGIEFRYYDGSAKIGFFGWDNNLNRYRFLTDATNSAETFSGTDASLQVGTLQITGAGTALDVDNNVNVDGTITADGQIISNVSSGAALVIPNTVKIANLNSDLLDGMTTAAANTASTVVNRDSSGDFSANIITVNSGTGANAGIQGNATTADTWKTSRTLTIDGVVDGSVAVTGGSDFTVTTTFNDPDIAALAGLSGTGLVTRTAANTYTERAITVSGSGIGVSNGNGVAGNPLITITSNSANSANNLVIRDASGNFAAGTITASLTGNVTGNVTGDVTGNADTATALETARTIGGVSFDGTANINLPGVNAAGNQDTSGNAATATALATARTIGGTSFDGTADITPATATQAANLSNHDTADLSEGTNLYYTEARVQAKLDNAYAQLKSMLNNLATASTLTLNLSGDPTPGSVVTLGSITASGLGGFTGSTGVSTSGGTGSGLTVNTTVNASGAITGLALNNAGTDYLIGDVLQITNPNLGGVSTLNLGTLSGGVGGFSSASNVSTTGGTGSGLTFDTTVDGNGNITNLTVNAAGTGYANGETITITNANAGGASTIDTLVGGTGYANGSAIATTGGNGSGLTLDLTTSNGVVTGAVINAAGTGYATDDTITIVNANATGVRTLGSIATAGTGYAAGSGIATTTSASGTSFTADITVDGNGAVTGVTINNDGTGFVDNEVITITNANATGVKTLGTISAGGTGYGSGTALSTTTNGGGSGLTVDVTVTNGVVDGVSINNDGSGYGASDVITIANANGSGVASLGGITGGTGYSTGTGIATTTNGSGSGLTVNITSVSGSGAITGLTINNDGLNYAASNTITVANANSSGVNTLGSISAAASGYSAGTVNTTTNGSGSGLTVAVSVNADGEVTGASVVNDGSGYANSDTITLTNANASGVKTLNSIMVAGTGYPASTTVTGVTTTSGGSGTGLTLDITTNASGHVIGAVINNDGSGYAAADSITIAGSGDGNSVTGVAAIHGNATTSVGAIHGNGGSTSVGTIHGNGAQIPVSAIHGNGCTIPVSAVHGNGATVDVGAIFANATINTATVFTHATFALSDITTMEVGATVTGGTSGTTGTITALGATSVTLDTVDGFFKVGETVGANDVTNLTITSFG